MCAQADRAGALGNYSPELTSPSTRSPNQRSRAFEVAKVSSRPGVLHEYRVLGPILVPERDATLSRKRPRNALSRRAGLRPLPPDPPLPVPVWSRAGRTQGARTACSRQERGVDVSSDSSKPPMGSPHRLQGEPRPRTAHPRSLISQGYPPRPVRSEVRVTGPRGRRARESSVRPRGTGAERAARPGGARASRTAG